VSNHWDTQSAVSRPLSVNELTQSQQLGFFVFDCASPQHGEERNVWHESSLAAKGVGGSAFANGVAQTTQIKEMVEITLAIVGNLVMGMCQIYLLMYPFQPLRLMTSV